VSDLFGGTLPDEITLTRHEAATVLFTLDEAIDRVRRWGGRVGPRVAPRRARTKEETDDQH
jgi:hypothetical protein